MTATVQEELCILTHPSPHAFDRARPEARSFLHFSVWRLVVTLLSCCSVKEDLKEKSSAEVGRTFFCVATVHGIVCCWRPQVFFKKRFFVCVGLILWISALDVHVCEFAQLATTRFPIPGFGDQVWSGIGCVDVGKKWSRTLGKIRFFAMFCEIKLQEGCGGCGVVVVVIRQVGELKGPCGWLGKLRALGSES